MGLGVRRAGVRETNVSGELWDGGASTDGIPKAFLRSVTDDVFEILLGADHLLVHAASGDKGHGKAFRDVALQVGHMPPLRVPTASRRLTERLNAIREELGPFPNSKLNFSTHGLDGEQRTVADRPEKQQTRMLKVECLECGANGNDYFLRASTQTLRRGAPICPVHLKPMWHEELPPEPKQKQAREWPRPVKLPELLQVTYAPDFPAGNAGLEAEVLAIDAPVKLLAAPETEGEF